MRKFTKRSAALVTAGVVAAGGAGAAYAAWSLSGSGSASASAGTVVPLEVTGASTTPLVPGSTSDVKITVTNPNKFPVLIKTVVFEDFASRAKGCDNKTLSQNKRADIPGNVVVPAATATGPAKFDFTFADSLVMSANPAEECKNAKFTFTTRVGAESHSANIQSVPPRSLLDESAQPAS